MSKTYIIDTNVLLYDPNSIIKLRGNTVIVPMAVLEEIDKHKKGTTETAKSARDVSRFLDSCREFGSLHQGVYLKQHDLTIKVCLTDRGSENLAVLVANGSDKDYNDNVILALACDLTAKAKAGKKASPIVLTKDIALRVKCDAMGVKTEDYKAGAIKDKEILEESVVTIEIEDDEAIDELYSGESILMEDIVLNVNQNVLLKGPTKSCMTRTDNENSIRKIQTHEPYSLKSKNKEQAFSIDLLMDPDIDVVALLGPAGTGKSIIALAAGLEQTVQKSRYNKVLVCRIPVAMGKEIGFLPGPQPLDAKVLTPTGFVAMGSLSVGDMVIGKDGKPVVIAQIRPQGTQMVYKVSTSDGRSTEATADHLWFTTTHNQNKSKKSGSVISTAQIKETLVKAEGWGNRKTIYNHRLPFHQPVEFTKQNLPIDPYILGVLLGDGSFGLNATPNFADFDGSIAEEVRKRLHPDLKLTPNATGTAFAIAQNCQNEVLNKVARKMVVTDVASGNSETYSSIGSFLSDNSGIHRSTAHNRAENVRTIDGIKYEFLNKDRDYNHPYKVVLDDLNLIGKKSWEKFVPEIYLRSSVADRVDILRGLMDTDGCCKKNGEASFSTTSEQLANNVKELVLSLGGKSCISIRDRVGQDSQANIDGRQIVSRRISYEVQVSTPVSINPFLLARKADRYSNSKQRHAIFITGVEEVAMKQVQCLVIDSEDHLYITDDYIVTHNSEKEKLAPWLAMTRDSFEVLTNLNKKGNQKIQANEMDRLFEQMQQMGHLEMLSTSHIRGRSLPKAFLIIEEAQNASPHEIKSIVSRAGQGTKVILLGDPDQIDVPYLDKYSNGLSVFVEKMSQDDEARKIFGHVILTKSERSKLAEVVSRVL